MKKRDGWIIVTNKKTYLFLALTLAALAFVVGDAVYTFVFARGTLESFLGNCFICAMIGIIGIYFFVRFNTYSHFYNPDHPKPGDRKNS